MELNEGVPEKLADKAPPRYYTDLGRGHDCLLRCKDCQRLVTYRELTTIGSCPKCGNRRVVEIETLSGWEFFKIWTGILDFEDRALFLKEFRRGK